MPLVQPTLTHPGILWRLWGGPIQLRASRCYAKEPADMHAQGEDKLNAVRAAVDTYGFGCAIPTVLAAQGSPTADSCCQPG